MKTFLAAFLLSDPVRTERDHRMDASRHPVELLQFAQVRPGMRVLNYHDISYLPVDRDAMNSKIFAAPKPGGHQADPPSDRFVLRFVKR